ncbi:dATP/dGTP pyrophosphohydrolase domain-containing protein [Aminobacter sp. BE322]|uniref:dATP/dGTP pyrophosphohydrolase domain-containing protein n=1 Tax=unclassified Aminobacter TaxID=2644704 RepID=UPI003D19E819
MIVLNQEALAIATARPYAALHRTTVVQAIRDYLEAPQSQSGEAFDMLAHLQRQRDWSGHTFGPGSRTKGVVDHICRELREIEADPSDISEWIDVTILALDGAWRAGHTPDQVIAALVAKQAKNEARDWPDWRTADPDKAIEHIRVGE